MSRARYGCSTQLAALALIALTVIAVMALASCASPRTSTNNNRVTTSWIQLPDGGSVLCVIYSAPNKGGVDCDWATAAREGETTDPAQDYRQETDRA